MEIKVSSQGGGVSPRQWEVPNKGNVTHGHLVDAEQQREQVEKKSWAVKILDSILSVSLAALFFGLPLFFLNLTFQGIIFEKQLFFYFWILVALVSWVTKSIIVGEIRIKRSPMDYIIGGFLVAYLLATIFSVDRWHSFFGSFGDPTRGLMNIIAVVLAYYLIISNFTKRRLVLALGGIVMSVGLVEIWTVIALFFSGNLPSWIVRNFPANLIGSFTALGMFLSMVLPLLIVVVYKVIGSGLSQFKKMSVGVVLGIFMLGNLFLLWVIFPFVSWIGILVGISLFVIFILSLIVRPADRWSWVAMVSFVAVLAILMVGSGDWMLKQKIPVEVSPSNGLSWNIAKEALKDKFFIGTGAATYGYDFSKYKPQEFNGNALYNLRFYQGNGLFFESLSTIGILGTIFLCLMLLSYLGISLYLLTREKERNKMYSLGLFSSAVIFLANVLAGRAEGGILIFGVLVIILSIAVIYSESSNENTVVTFSLKASPRYALALAFIFMLVCAGVVYMFVFMGKVFVADAYMKKAVSTSGPSENGTVSQMVKAINLYPNEGRYYTRAGQEYMFLANKEALKDEDSRNVSLVQQYLNNAISLSVKGKDKMPNDVFTIEALAQIYENAGLYVSGSSDLTAQFYGRALELEPHNPVYFIKLGQVKTSKATDAKDDERKKFLNEALDQFKKSIEKKADYAVGYFYIALAENSLGNTDSAVEAMQKAVSYDSKNVDYFYNLGRLYQQRAQGQDETYAENIYDGLLAQNDKDINVHLSLGMLYEKQKKNDVALREYRKVLENLPPEAKDARDQINKMISNIQSGISNLDVNNLTQAPIAPDQSAPPENQATEQPTPAPTSPISTPVPTPTPTESTKPNQPKQ